MEDLRSSQDYQTDDSDDSFNVIRNTMICDVDDEKPDIFEFFSQSTTIKTTDDESNQYLLDDTEMDDLFDENENVVDLKKFDVEEMVAGNSEINENLENEIEICDSVKSPTASEIEEICGSQELFKEDDEIEEICRSQELFSDDDDTFNVNKIVIKIEELVQHLLHDLVEYGHMELNIPDRSKWSNVEVSNHSLCLSQQSSQRRVSTRNVNSKFRMAIILYLLAEIYELLTSGSKCSLRELYYNNPKLCQSQMNVDRALKDICSFLNVLPWEIGIYASSKCHVAGSMKLFLPNNEVIDSSFYTRTGVLMPLNSLEAENLHTSAEFVLLIEKETAFQNLLRNGILSEIGRNMILITGKGYPDMNTRVLIHKIWNKFNIPIYTLVDADPYGIEIMLMYRFGSKESTYKSELLVCPQIKWIGIYPSEIESLKIAAIPLTAGDRKKIFELLNRTYVQDQVRDELEILLKINKKAEIEGVSSSFQLNLPLNDYVVNKIKKKENERIATAKLNIIT